MYLKLFINRFICVSFYSWLSHPVCSVKCKCKCKCNVFYVCFTWFFSLDWSRSWNGKCLKFWAINTMSALSLCIFCNIKILFPHIYDYGTHWMLFVNMLLATVATSYMPRIHYSLTPSSDCARLWFAVCITFCVDVCMCLNVNSCSQVSSFFIEHRI